MTTLRTGGGSFFVIFLMVMVAVFIYRDQIGGWVKSDPEIVIPKEVSEKLGINSTIKLKGFFDKYKNLESKVLELEKKVYEATQNGSKKIDDLTKQLTNAKNSLEEAKNSIDKLKESGENIKGLFSSQNKGTEES